MKKRIPFLCILLSALLVLSQSSAGIAQPVKKHAPLWNRVPVGGSLQLGAAVVSHPSKDTIIISARDEEPHGNIGTESNEQNVPSCGTKIADVLEGTGMSPENRAKILIDSLVLALGDMEQKDAYHYSQTDALLFQIENALMSIDWPSVNEQWLYEPYGELGGKDYLMNLARASRYGKRYGTKIIEILAYIERGVRSEVFFSRKDHYPALARFNTLRPYNSVPPSEVPSPEEGYPIALQLIERATKYLKEYGGLHLYSDEKEALQKYAPQEFSELLREAEISRQVREGTER